MDAAQLYTSIKALISKGGFQIKEFSSNSKEMMKHLQKVDKTENASTREGKLVLGLRWSTVEDALKLKINLEHKHLTRRGILSIIHGIYDPLGLRGPAVLIAKRLFQRTCELRLDWDVELAPSIKEEWITFIKHLPLLERFEIPRCCMTKRSKEI